jgi:hypothetical protein
MWIKLYVTIVVVIVLVLFHLLRASIVYLENNYHISTKYNVPMNCLASTLCGMSGNVLFLYIIYMIIPEQYYSNLIKALDPKQLEDNAKNDILGINKAVDGVANKLSFTSK